jgi:hypothetical protein
MILIKDDAGEGFTLDIESSTNMHSFVVVVCLLIPIEVKWQYSVL